MTKVAERTGSLSRDLLRSPSSRLSITSRLRPAPAPAGWTPAAQPAPDGGLRAARGRAVRDRECAAPCTGVAGSKGRETDCRARYMRDRRAGPKAQARGPAAPLQAGRVSGPQGLRMRTSGDCNSAIAGGARSGSGTCRMARERRVSAGCPVRWRGSAGSARRTRPRRPCRGRAAGSGDRTFAAHRLYRA